MQWLRNLMKFEDSVVRLRDVEDTAGRLSAVTDYLTVELASLFLGEAGCL